MYNKESIETVNKILTQVVLILLCLVYTSFLVYQTNIFDSLKSLNKITIVDDWQDNTLTEEELKSSDSTVEQFVLNIFAKENYFPSLVRKHICWTLSFLSIFQLEIPLPPPQHR